MKSGHIIVVGNEKGGAGKSTMAVHLAIACARCGLKVAALDLDRRQRTFERYFENRKRWAEQNGADLPKPEFSFLAQAVAADRVGAEREEKLATQDLIAKMASTHDIVIIDAPGADTPASRAAHGCADTLITLNVIRIPIASDAPIAAGRFHESIMMKSPVLKTLCPGKG